MAGLVLPNGTSYAKEYANPLESPQSYAQYLESYDQKEALRLGVDPRFLDQAVRDSKEILGKYNELTSNEQTKLLHDMQSISVIQNSFVSSEEIQKSAPALDIAASSRSISHDYTMSLLGIDWTIYRVEGEYEYNSKGVTKKLGANGYVKRNLNPLVQTSKTSSSDEINGKEYAATVVFDYKIGPIKDLSVQIGSAYVKVYGDKNGKTGGRGWTE